MRNLLFFATMATLLPMAVVRPFAGVLLWSWISFMNPHREIWGSAANLPWAAMVLGGTLLGCVLAQEPRRLPINAVTLLLLLLVAIFTITTLVGLGEPVDAWAKWDRTAKMILALLLTAALLTDRHRLDALIWLMVIAIGYYGVRGGAFTILTGGSFRVLGPEATTIADNNHIGTAMLVAIPLMNYLRMHARHRIVQIGLMAAMVLTLFAVVGTYSRGAFIALGAVTLLLWWRSRRKLIGGLVIAACVAGAMAFMPQAWVARMNSIETYEEDASATTRLKLWEASFRLAMDRPLVGSGFRGPYSQAAVDRVMPGGPARAVHSIWFEVLGEHGFPGFLAWLGLTVSGIWYSLRLSRLGRDHPGLQWAGDLGRMVGISILAYCIGGTFLSLGYWDFYWTLLVVAAAAHALALAELRNELPAAPAARGWRAEPLPGAARARAAAPRAGTARA
ncbi:probable O-glycosylation ligase, exosortase A-associated [Roseomonas rosea]|uniref:Probable O-glycosylation ligase, exosortase A-associated n=1 Tax=Muricoccus roseus TaxID=198092 RepID=A0A1M6N994_9PROT|nr:putative O-glycosylation ligase, exosortase A system-associated [Roseomonas rosea]SHJ92214.1 probable O-glycosylation ligase, exosortase A-associated [Roseomonas rosea]